MSNPRNRDLNNLNREHDDKLKNKIRPIIKRESRGMILLIEIFARLNILFDKFSEKVQIECLLLSRRFSLLNKRKE